MSKTNWPEPTMMLMTSKWASLDSFSLMPISADCPFIEALYNPAVSTLAIIGKTKKDTFHMLPRLDDNGQALIVKGSTEPRKHRVQQESYTEYYITEKQEIVDFISKFAVNHVEFEYLEVLEKKTMDDPNKSGILTGAQPDLDQPTKLIIEK